MCNRNYVRRIPLCPNPLGISKACAKPKLALIKKEENNFQIHKKQLNAIYFYSYCSLFAVI